MFVLLYRKKCLNNASLSIDYVTIIQDVFTRKVYIMSFIIGSNKIIKNV